MKNLKVLLVNGSPHKHGCTDRALQEVGSALAVEDVDSEIFWIGPRPVGGCIACHGCDRKGACVFDDVANEFTARAAEADGFVFGAPVHYAHAAASLLGFMDRAFYSSGRAGKPNPFTRKPAAAVASARRAGTTASLGDIEKFFTISQMPVVSSFYWNEVHGYTPADVEADKEGIATMQQLGHNMAWMLKSLEAGRAAGIEPEDVTRVITNFIR